MFLAAESISPCSCSSKCTFIGEEKIFWGSFRNIESKGWRRREDFERKEGEERDLVEGSEGALSKARGHVNLGKM